MFWNVVHALVVGFKSVDLENLGFFNTGGGVLFLICWVIFAQKVCLFSNSALLVQVNLEVYWKSDIENERKWQTGTTFCPQNWHPTALNISAMELDDLHEGRLQRCSSHQEAVDVGFLDQFGTSKNIEKNLRWPQKGTINWNINTSTSTEKAAVLQCHAATVLDPHLGTRHDRHRPPSTDLGNGQPSLLPLRWRPWPWTPGWLHGSPRPKRQNDKAKTKTSWDDKSRSSLLKKKSQRIWSFYRDLLTSTNDSPYLIRSGNLSSANCPDGFIGNDDLAPVLQSDSMLQTSGNTAFPWHLATLTTLFISFHLFISLHLTPLASAS